MGNFEVRKSDLSKRLDGRIKLNFSMIHRDILLLPVSFMSLPARFNESHRLKPQKPGGRGPVTVIAYWRRLMFLSPDGTNFSYYYFRQRVLEYSEPRTLCPSSWTHLARAKFGCNRKISLTWSICCFLTELSPPTTSLLGLQWMGLVESHKDFLKWYRSRNILRVIMVKFRSILPS